MGNGGRILIVDDSSTIRLKLKKAVEALGHEGVAVNGGKAALEEVGKSNFDVVLLDIVMPEMDGFEVLKRLKSARETKDLPVIVISSLDDDMSSVVQAIELGAEDFLPKDFEMALLQARVSTCIEKKRLRDIEREYLRQVSKLTRAATALESGKFNPSKLGIQDVAARTDGLGRLANVFSTMAQKVYERERKMRQNIRTFRGGLLLLVVGVIWGLVVPLSKMAANISDHPIGLAVLTNLLSGLACVGYATWRGRMPKLRTLTRSDWNYILIFAVIGSIITDVMVYWLAAKLPAFILSIFMVLEGFAVFAFAAIMRIEAASLKRFAGLAIGLVGVAVIVVYGEATGDTDEWIWLLVALIIPVSYGVEGLYISEKRPQHLDTIAVLGLAFLVSVVFLVPFAAVFQDFIPSHLLLGRLGIVTVLITAAVIVSSILIITLIATTGAVFASQSAYATTACGIGWSMILLGEYIPLWTWGALALIVVGLIMVEPKQEAEEEPPEMIDAIEDLPI